MRFLNLLPVLATLTSAQTVYLIRHGEKPSDGGNGLSAQGVERAQCLRNVFGASSQYDIGYIIAEQPKSSKPIPYSDIKGRMNTDRAFKVGHGHVLLIPYNPSQRILVSLWTLPATVTMRTVSVTW